MPKFKVTIEARKHFDVDQTIEVEAKNAKEAERLVQAMIDNNQIQNRKYEDVDSGYYSDERVGGVEKLS